MCCCKPTMAWLGGGGSGAQTIFNNNLAYTGGGGGGYRLTLTLHLDQSVQLSYQL